MATGEDWYKIMFDTTRSPEYGCSDDFRSCGNGNNNKLIRFWKSLLYFLYNYCSIHNVEFVYPGSYAII